MQSITLERKKVYDPVHRLLHAGLAVSIILLLATALFAKSMPAWATEKAAWRLHSWAGFSLVAILVVRFVWGIIGLQHARVSDLLRGRDWLLLLCRQAREEQPRYGHDPRASLAYLGFYAILALMSVTGIILAAVDLDMGPFAPMLYDAVAIGEFAQEPHEILAWSVVAFIGLHLGAMIWHEHREGRPVAQRKYVERLPVPASCPVRRDPPQNKRCCLNLARVVFLCDDRLR